MPSIQNTVIITVVTMSVAKLLKESVSDYKFVNLFIIFSLLAILNSNISQKLNRFVDNSKLLLKFMFEYDNAGVNSNFDKFEDLLNKVRDLFKKIKEGGYSYWLD